MNYPEKARRVIQLEIDELQRLHARIDDRFAQAIDLLLACVRSRGKLIVCGVGKSGSIGRKLAATLNSTGATTVLLDVGDALHGDLGVIDPGDLAILLSYSGETSELLNLLPHLKRFSIPVIAITGGLQSTLAKNADVVLDVHVTQEACPLNLAPTASTTAALVLGDAIAVACLEARGFNRDDFARSHPGGALGRRLLTSVADIMRSGAALPRVAPDTLIPDALTEMSAKGMGMTIVLKAGRPVGLFTDGDLRRMIAQHGDIRALPVSAGMSRHPRSIAADAPAIEAATIMDEHKLNQMLVLDGDGLLLGALHMHDLLAAKVI
ncbi:MAG TPA: D-arabinose 5-phosphate isomerase [Verrucomicrobiales bacterium]|nr:D-arabinose 5-phosphate isomerase [Verrucomicrobiales bacterium]